MTTTKFLLYYMETPLKRQAKEKCKKKKNKSQKVLICQPINITYSLLVGTINCFSRMLNDILILDQQ